MTTVTLLIFSGRPDPSWDLAPGEVDALLPHLRDVAPAPQTSGLGYRGFLVRSNDPGVPSELVVHNSPKLEQLLLRTGERCLAPDIIRGAAEAIE